MFMAFNAIQMTDSPHVARETNMTKIFFLQRKLVRVEWLSDILLKRRARFYLWDSAANFCVCCAGLIPRNSAGVNFVIWKDPFSQEYLYLLFHKTLLSQEPAWPKTTCLAISENSITRRVWDRIAIFGASLIFLEFWFSLELTGVSHQFLFL